MSKHSKSKAQHSVENVKQARKQSFGSVLGAEVKRVFLRPKALISIGIFALVTILIFAGVVALTGAMASSAAETGVPAPEMGFVGFSVPLSVLSMCFGIYASSLSARDYNDGMLLASLLVVPSRGKLFVARLLPWVVASFLVSLVVFLLCFVISLKDITDMGSALAEMGLAILSCSFSTVLGFCCGTITKRGAVSVLSYLALTFILGTAFNTVGMFVPEAFSNVFKWGSALLPGNAFSNMLNLIAQNSTAEIAPLISLIIAITWAVGLSIVAYVLFKKRATLGR